MAWAPTVFPAPPQPPTPEPEPLPTPIWIGAHPNNYGAARPNGLPIAIVMHTMQGTLAGCDSWFNNPSAQVSSHYGLGLQGQLHQYVRLWDRAYANGVLQAGNRWPGPQGVNPNAITCSIETDDQGKPASTPVTDAMYGAALDACRIILAEFPGIVYLCTHACISPQDRSGCPGTRWTSGKMQALAATLGLSLVL